jgi:hypothetical protein
LSYAQTLIPKAGVTLPKIEYEENVGAKSKIGFTLGVGYNIAINDLFSIQPELSFVQKGTKSKSSYTYRGDVSSYTQTLEGNLTINYLELPVLAKVTFGSGTKFFLNAGPSIGFGLGGKATYEIIYSETYMGETVTETMEGNGKVKFGDEPDEYEGEDAYFDNRLDLGLQFGGGAIVANKIMIDVRYGLGFSNLWDGEENKSQHRVFQFTVGIPLTLK